MPWIAGRTLTGIYLTLNAEKRPTKALNESRSCRDPGIVLYDWLRCSFRWLDGRRDYPAGGPVKPVDGLRCRLLASQKSSKISESQSRNGIIEVRGLGDIKGDRGCGGNRRIPRRRTEECPRGKYQERGRWVESR
jgi:hypothetical protein